MIKTVNGYIVAEEIDLNSGVVTLLDPRIFLYPDGAVNAKGNQAGNIIRVTVQVPNPDDSSEQPLSPL
jgi:hypothetical protein